MAAPLLFDTDILVEYLRGRPAAVSFVEERKERLLVSAVTIAELWAGVRGKEEETALEVFLTAFDTVAVDGETARRGGDLKRRFGPSHGIGLGDALIAASALISGGILVTFNRKHFPMLPRVLVPYKRR